MIAVLLAAVMVCITGCGSATAISRHGRSMPTDEFGPTGSLLPPGYDTALLPTVDPLPYIGYLTPAVITKQPTPGISGHNHRINRKGFSVEAIAEYFDEIALHAEYGSSDNRVHKWNDEIVMCVKGTPTAQDRLVLQSILWKMNSVYGFPGIRETVSEFEANLVITFANDAEYTRITPSTINDSTDGFATCWWQNSVIYKAEIGIRTSISQNERNSVIWEEMVQSTGLQNDSYLYPESLFYQGYNEVQEPTDLDWILFEILYHPDVPAGLSRAEALLLSTTLLE